VSPREVVFAGSSHPAVSVVVAAWGSSPHLLDSLAWLGSQRTAMRYEVVLVLNQVAPDVAEAVAGGVRGASVISSRSDLGFAGAANVGVARAAADLVAIVHDDVETSPDWLDVLVGSAAAHPEADVTGCLVADAGAAPSASSATPVEVSECAFLVRRSVWESLGGLAEIFYPFGFAVADFCARVVESGGQIRLEPRATVRRHRSGRTNHRFKSVVMDLNAELFATRHSKGRPPAVAPAPGSGRGGVSAGPRAPRRGGGKRRLLVIDDAVPEQAVGAGSGRMAEVLGELTSGGRFAVDLLPLVVRERADPARVAALGVDVVSGDLGRLLRAEGRRYGAVVVSRPHNWAASIGKLRRFVPEVPVVYDAEALFHRRLARQADFAIDAPTVIRVAREAARLEAIERGIAGEADFVVAISEDEADFFRDNSPDPGNVVVHPPFLAGASTTPAQLARRRDIGFVAGWSAGPDSPNADALEWFARRILPGVRARTPGARLLVTGANPPVNVRRLVTPAVEFLGQVPSLADFYSSVRVVVVPTRYGSGVKLKTVEAVQFGVPTVATTVGAEGIPLDDRGAVVVVDDPDRFARAVAALLGDDDAWRAQRARVVAQSARWVERSPGGVWVSLAEELTGAAPPGGSRR
jgi:GT2 family glycosyltransferase/glycosyltransferase involved in cell wall biosynthesis